MLIDGKATSNKEIWETFWRPEIWEIFYERPLFQHKVPSWLPKRTTRTR
ncbi:hypothetical protein AWU68_0387 [Corynebacterium simulans]|nr:hypothetical protein AWU68_0387 [Corynebacterium simulans]